MKRTLWLLTCLSTMLLGACTSDSALPNPTGKGAVRAINAIPGAPEILFLIEERSLGGVSYKNSTAPAEYDDFSYDFNFEILSPGDTGFTRIATETLQVEADADHVFLLTGSLTAPTITVWNGVIRTFDAAETVFEVQFAHASATLGDVDVYFDAPGTAPGINPPAATLSFGELGPVADFETGEFVMTVTAAGDANIVHFTSVSNALLPRFAHIITLFDGDADDTAPFIARSMTSVGNLLTLPDAGYPPQIRFIHGANTLQSVDIYEDDLLTVLVHAGLDFKAATTYLDTLSEPRTYYFTPANSTATILFEQLVSTPAWGTLADLYLIGDTDAWTGVRHGPVRAATSNFARLRLFNAAVNHVTYDVYILDRDEPLVDDSGATVLNATYASASPPINLPAGNFDLYVTVRAEKTVLAGPYPIDAVLGNNIDLLIVDTVAPDEAELVDITP